MPGGETRRVGSSTSLVLNVDGYLEPFNPKVETQNGRKRAFDSYVTVKEVSDDAQNGALFLHTYWNGRTGNLFYSGW